MDGSCGKCRDDCASRSSGDGWEVVDLSVLYICGLVENSSDFVSSDASSLEELSCGYGRGDGNMVFCNSGADCTPIAITSERL